MYDKKPLQAQQDAKSDFSISHWNSEKAFDIETLKQWLHQESINLYNDDLKDNVEYLHRLSASRTTIEAVLKKIESLGG